MQAARGFGLAVRYARPAPPMTVPSPSMIKVGIATQSSAWCGRVRPLRAGDPARSEVNESNSTCKSVEAVEAVETFEAVATITADAARSVSPPLVRQRGADGLGARQVVGAGCCFESDDVGQHESDATEHPEQKIERLAERHRNERAGVWQGDPGLLRRGHEDAPAIARAHGCWVARALPSRLVRRSERRHCPDGADRDGTKFPVDKLGQLCAVS